MTSHIRSEIAADAAELRSTESGQGVPLSFSQLVDLQPATLLGRSPRIDSLVLLVTDLMGFTPLVERLGDLRAQHVIREHNALIRGCLREHRGIEVAHTGDGILACFLVPKDAIACATAIQAALAARNLVTHQPPLHVRIGVHSGSALVEEDRLFGATVVAAVRICNQCQPGQVLVSSAVRASLPELVDCFRSCGQHVLKGFTEHMELFVVRRDFAAQLQQ